MMTSGKIRRGLFETDRKLSDPDSVTTYLLEENPKRKAKVTATVIVGRAKFLSRRLKLSNGIFRSKILAILGIEIIYERYDGIIMDTDYLQSHMK